MDHTLVVYRGSKRADAAVRELARVARECDGRLTVLALAAEEPVSRGCCDTRSVLWNRIQRELADDDLQRARIAIGDDQRVELGVLVQSGRNASDAVSREARRRGATRIVVADPRKCGLSRRDRRRLQAA